MSAEFDRPGADRQRFGGAGPLGSDAPADSASTRPDASAAPAEPDTEGGAEPAASAPDDRSLSYERFFTNQASIEEDLSAETVPDTSDFPKESFITSTSVQNRAAAQDFERESADFTGSDAGHFAAPPAEPAGAEGAAAPSSAAPGVAASAIPAGSEVLGVSAPSTTSAAASAVSAASAAPAAGAVPAVPEVAASASPAAAPSAPPATSAGAAERAVSTGAASTPDTTAAPATPVPSPGHATVKVEGREGSHAQSGATPRLAWGARTDVGLVREHNEDSYLVRAPVFAVCDGMGGHAAGEVASAIAIQSIAEHAPAHADDVQLGAAVETANLAIMEAAATGRGKPGMGCTASAVVIEDGHVAIAHVGDSRIYLLNAGTLVRLTHDHSYVEELVEAGEITADEARVHPSRSVITRALGSDPDMYADHFGLDVTPGDRLIICSDGLSSMVEDSEIEALAVSSPTPQAAADTLVAAALTAGGHDNVSVVVIDIIDDGAVAAHHRRRLRTIALTAAAIVLALALLAVAGVALVRSSWYVGTNGTTVGIYRGINGNIFGLPLSELVETTSVEVGDLPEAVRKALVEGVRVGSEAEAAATVDSYRAQIDADKSQAAATADRAGDAAADAEADPSEEVDAVEPPADDAAAGGDAEAGGEETEASQAAWWQRSPAAPARSGAATLQRATTPATAQLTATVRGVAQLGSPTVTAASAPLPAPSPSRREAPTC